MVILMIVCADIYYRITLQREACRYRVRVTMCRYTPGYNGMPLLVRELNDFPLNKYVSENLKFK